MKNQREQMSPLTMDLQPKIRDCPYNKSSTLICCSKNCLKTAFMCAEKSCKCFKDHIKCPHIQIQSIRSSIKAKIIPFETIHQSIIQQIEKTIDELSDFRQKFSNQMKENLKFYGLTPNDSKFLNALNTSNEIQVTGQQISQMFLLFMNEQSKLTEKNLLEEKFTAIWQALNKEIQSKTTSIFKLLSSIKNHQLFTNPELFKGSKLILDKEYKENFCKMFDSKTLSESKLLYRASQNNFSASVFHQKCDNIPHTVTLCKTGNGQLIGGYTPLVWNKSQSGQQIKDQTGKTFTFSLTNNHKFELNKSKTAIYQYSDSGPMFGTNYPDLHIDNKANQRRSSWSKINQSYYNENYIKDDPASYQKFNGDPQKSYNYKVEDWEVWQVKFTE